MTLPKYTPEKRREIANKVDIGEQYLYQILTRVKVAPPLLARKLNNADQKIRLKDLRPKDWQVLWPELKKPSGTDKSESIARKVNL